MEPIFKTNCYSCHGGTAMVGLDLRTATSVLRGSHEGPVVAKHEPGESLLYRKVSQRLMPPPAFNLKLTDSEIDTVRRWIEAGAPSDEEAIIAAKTKEETARFHELALPIFEDRCFACHATDTPMGGLDLRTVQSVLKGSESGPVISDLGSIKSILIRKLTSGEMPPPGMGRPLGDGEIRTLARWIDTSDFRLLRPHAERTTFNPAEAPPVTGEDRQFWSFRTPEAAPVPKVKNRKHVRTPIDAFLLQRLESEGPRFLSRCLQAHVIAPRLAGPDRSSSRLRRISGPTSTTSGRMRTRGSSTRCWSRSTTVSGGAATGWMRPATATSPGSTPPSTTSSSSTGCGVTATG